MEENRTNYDEVLEGDEILDDEDEIIVSKKELRKEKAIKIAKIAGVIALGMATGGLLIKFFTGKKDDEYDREYIVTDDETGEEITVKEF